jgi:phosphate transport system permease protein
MIGLSASMVSTVLLIGSGLFILLVASAGDWLFLSSEPFEAGFLDRLNDVFFAKPNVENGLTGLFPAIVGTLSLVMVMTLFVAPLGVATAIYLSEYARDTWYTKLIRISITNLAGVPAIIYGIFGLGFFVYGLGGQVDALFYADRLPSPTFGTPGLLWAALTLALVNLPVVIVAVTEGLDALPNDLREASIALGATKSETVFKAVMPAALPSVFSGLILATARAAGEVSPLLLVGAVKFSPSLPLSSRAPFIEFEQKFMHLGFQLFDAVLFARLPPGGLGWVACIALILVLLIGVLNVTAVSLRAAVLKRQTVENPF